MIRQSFHLLFVCCFLSVGIDGQGVSNVWNGLTPLASTRKDVERVLAKPIAPRLDIYETEKERVTIFYSRGSCGKDPATVWNVPKDTVLEILVHRRFEGSLKHLMGTSWKSYRRYLDPEIPGLFHYSIEDGSVRFATRLLGDKAEDAVYIVYAPTKADADLACPVPKPHQRKGRE